jgi:hypothetical protein
MLGVDLEPAAGWLSAPDGVAFRLGDAGQLEPAQISADVVIAKDLLHHMVEPAKGVQLIAHAARRHAVIIEANRDNPIMDLYTKYNGDRHFTEVRFRELVLKEGSPLHWEFALVKAYPFYLPPVISLRALWVWPVTLAMLIAFKIARSRKAAHLLFTYLSGLPWRPPFTVAIGSRSPDVP